MDTVKKKKGFTILEVLLALLIVSISLIVFGSFAKSLKITSTARQETQAIADLRTAMGKIRSAWGVPSGYTSLELPYFIAAPQGYTQLSVEVKAIDGSGLNYSCDYSFDSSVEKFVNNCPTINEELSVFRSVSLITQFDDVNKTPIELTTLLARPIE